MDRPITVSDVLVAVSRRFNVTPDDLRGPRRMRQLARPRQIAYLLAATTCPSLSLPAIGRAIGDRDHSTILHGIRCVRKAMDADREFAATVADLQRNLKPAIPAWLAEVV